MVSSKLIAHKNNNNIWIAICLLIFNYFKILYSYSIIDNYLYWIVFILLAKSLVIEKDSIILIDRRFKVSNKERFKLIWNDIGIGFLLFTKKNHFSSQFTWVNKMVWLNGFNNWSKLYRFQFYHINSICFTEEQGLRNMENLW